MGRLILAALAVFALAGPVAASAADRGIDHITAGFTGEPDFVDITPDGSGVVVETVAALDPVDVNANDDLYLRKGGRWILITSGTPPQGWSPQFRYVAMSRDASHVFFTTHDRLAAGDTDDTQDVYESVGGRIASSRWGTTLPTGQRSEASAQTGRACISRPRSSSLPPTATPSATCTFARRA